MLRSGRSRGGCQAHQGQRCEGECEVSHGSALWVRICRGRPPWTGSGDALRRQTVQPVTQLACLFFRKG
jgi:hypothetical protein